MRPFPSAGRCRAIHETNILDRGAEIDDRRIKIAVSVRGMVLGRKRGKRRRRFLENGGGRGGRVPGGLVVSCGTGRKDTFGLRRKKFEDFFLTRLGRDSSMIEGDVRGVSGVCSALSSRVYVSKMSKLGYVTCPFRTFMRDLLGGGEVTNRSSSTATFGPKPMNRLKNPCFAGRPMGTAGLGAATGIKSDAAEIDPLFLVCLYPTPRIGA